MMIDTEILIVGAGPAGLATAITLSRAGHEVTVIDSANDTAFKAGEHLGPNALSYLTTLGFSKEMLHAPHLPCAGIRMFWGSTLPRYKDALFSLNGLGWILSRQHFDRQMIQAAKGLGVRIFHSTNLLKASSDADKVEVILRRNGQRELHQVAFLVDATGRAAKGARLLGARVIRDDRMLGTCFIHNSKVGDPLQESSWAHLESCPTGWWFSLPTPDGKRVSYWMTDRPLHGQFSKHDLDQLLTSAPQMRVLLGECGELQGLYHRSAHSQCLDRFYGPRWAAVGDAAMSFDPVSSEGITKGLRMGIAVGEAIIGALGNDTEMLQAYGKLCQSEFNSYLHKKASYYRMEQRWTFESFWAKRRRVETNPNALAPIGEMTANSLIVRG